MESNKCKRDNCKYYAMIGGDKCSEHTIDFVPSSTKMFCSTFMKNREASKYINVTKEQISIIKHYIKILKPSIDIWEYMDNNNIYINASHAADFLDIVYKNALLYDIKWKYEHAFCCRVVDKWNHNSKHGVGECYYTDNIKELNDIKKPSGYPWRFSDIS